MAEEDYQFGELYSGPLRVSAIQLNELYRELRISGGFSKDEALFLVGQVLISNILEIQISSYEDTFDDEQDEQDYNDDDGDFI